MSEETKKRISEALKGKSSNALGKHWKLSEKTKKKMSERMSGSDNSDNIQPLCRNCNSRKYTQIINYKYV